MCSTVKQRKEGNADDRINEGQMTSVTVEVQRNKKM